MARNATPLLRAHPLPELNGGVELLIVESRLAHPDPSGDSGYEEEHSLCVLILIAPSEADRRRMRAEAQRYMAAQASVMPLPGMSWAADAIRLLNELDLAFLDVVIGLPAHCQTTAHQVAALLRGLKTSHHRVGSAVAVAKHPADWEKVDATMGMVSAPGLSAAEGAILLHAGLAQLSAAPGLLSCVSGEEVDEVLRTVCRPAKLALVDLGERSTEVLIKLQPPQATGLIFCLAPMTLTDYKRLRQFVLQAGVKDVAIVAPSGLTVWNGVPHGVAIISGGGAHSDAQTD